MKWEDNMSEKYEGDFTYALNSIEQARERKEDFTLFYGGVFSQWYRCQFKYDGVFYNCAEQAMMAMKAKHFGDMINLKLIMESNSPYEQKMLGRTVENFNVEEWNKVAKNYVTEINYCKFKQNPNILTQLLDTEGTTLVEASPSDKIWGIGLAESDARCYNRKKWRGTNWLGECITNVRERIMEEMR
jgi:ribA/ribD-fused uncharacterized protein